jgi:hypothetical protein
MNIMNRFDKNEDKMSIDEPWISVAVEQLREPLDPSVSAQLKAARRSALEVPVRRSLLNIPYIWGVPALASVFAIMVSFSLWDRSEKEHQSLHTADSIALEDLSIIKASDDWELYKNIEFLNWMEQDNNGLNKG